MRCERRARRQNPEYTRGSFVLGFPSNPPDWANHHQHKLLVGGGLLERRHQVPQAFSG